jgi:hypothetical protein
VRQHTKVNIRALTVKRAAAELTLSEKTRGAVASEGQQGRACSQLQSGTAAVTAVACRMNDTDSSAGF